MAKKQTTPNHTTRTGSPNTEDVFPEDRADPAAAPAEIGGEDPNPAPQVGHDEIARLAYSYWENRGRQDGSPEDDWFRAERELRAPK